MRARRRTQIGRRVDNSTANTGTVLRPGGSQITFTAGQPAISIDTTITTSQAAITFTAGAPAIETIKHQTTTGAAITFTAGQPTVTIVNGGTALPMDDSFTGSGSLSGSTPDTSGANTWSVLSATWTRSGGSVSVSSMSGHAYAVYDAGTADCTITLNVDTAASGSYMPGIAFRCDGSGGWYFEVRDGGWYLNYTGNDPVDNNPSWGAVNGQAYELKVVMLGNDFELFIDGVSVANINDSRNASNTSHGMHFYEDDNGSTCSRITIAV